MVVVVHPAVTGEDAFKRSVQKRREESTSVAPLSICIRASTMKEKLREACGVE